MRLLTDAQVRRLADPEEAARAIEAAFAEAAGGGTALLPRKRIVSGALKLSAMAAILPGAGVAGAKVYTTREGAFRFVVVLFDAESGAPLATLEADALTEIRTAAVTEVVAARLAPGVGGKIAVFGTGVQARAHVRALARRLHPACIAVASRGDAGEFCSALTLETGIEVRPEPAGRAIEGARVVVTATRATEPLFDGAGLAPGCLVAAVGSTLPHARELDDATMRRASRVLVEDRAQAMTEAGDLIGALESGALEETRIADLAAELARPGAHDAAGGRDGGGGSGDVTIFKSVGIALEDIAVAARIWAAARAESDAA
jgi:ornithine cyclodeaminase